MPLLQNMGKLVRQQVPPCARAGRVLASPEYHIAARRIGERVEGLCGFSRRSIRMHTHLAEVPAKARLHESTGARIERLAARRQRPMYRLRPVAAVVRST